MRLILDGAGYAYPGGTTVGPVDLAVQAGERLLITGRSGCGKSTLLRLAAGLLARHGEGRIFGEVRVEGGVGFVSQEPADQLVTGTVADEVAFGPESAGWPADRVERRIVEALDQLDLRVGHDRDPRRLSGGQQQRLVVAASLAVGGGLLLLDEPLAQLDPDGARLLLDRLAALADDGVAVVLVEHRLRQCLPWAGRVLVLDGALTERIPEVPTFPPGRPAPPPGPVIASVLDLRWSFGETRALDGVTVEIRAGERVALVGPNGAGKSTLLAALAGRLGSSEVEGRVVEVPQDPDLSLFCRSVREELAYGPVEAGLPDVGGLVDALAAAFSLTDALDAPPQALSRGQRLRVAVAAALACGPDLLLLDEPTSGQDHDAIVGMIGALERWLARSGRSALVFATHDLALARARATRIVALRDGRVAYDGPPDGWR